MAKNKMLKVSTTRFFYELWTLIQNLKSSTINK